MTNEVDALTHVAEILAGPVGTFFVIVLVAFAVATKRFVPGWVFDQCVKDGEQCRTDLSARVTKSEVELETLRRDRMGSQRG